MNPPDKDSTQKILASACLAGKACAYDGRDRLDERVRELVESGGGIPVCPEQLGGLPTPREPAEIAGGDGSGVLAGTARVVTASGEDVTGPYLEGARRALAEARAHGCHRAILKSRSPSCGCRSIHDGTFSGGLHAGEGVTAALLSANGIEVISEEDL